MRQYKVYFLNGDVVTLSEIEFREFNEATIKLPKGFVFLFEVDRTIGLRVENITYIESEDIEANDKVVTAPTASELKAEEQQRLREQPVTLDDQLDNPEVGQ